jgi:hypothetical protein
MIQGGLISDRLSIWLQSPYHFPNKDKLLRSNLAAFFLDWSQSEKLSEILPPLENPISYQYRYENGFATGTFISTYNEQ